MIVVVVLIFVFFLFYIWFSVTKPKNFPPGPPWKPIVGSLSYLQTYSKKLGLKHLALTALAKEWNTNILGLKLGDELLVNVEDYATIKYIISSDEYDQRPTNYFIKLRSMGTSKGISFAEGKLWSENRKFVARYLRIISKTDLDEKISQEIYTLTKVIDSQKEVQIGTLLPNAVINALWAFIAGNRVDDKTFERNQLLDIICKRAKAFDTSVSTLAQYPWLRFLIPEKSGYNLIKQFNTELKEFLMQTINEHNNSWTDGIDTDFIYSYINEIKSGNNNGSTFTDEELFFVCVDLFIGGFTTITYTLDYFFLMMILHPNVQSKIQKELDATFDKNQRIGYQDRFKVPYVAAVIKEVHRYVAVIPNLGPRRTAKKTTLAGYTIPKNTTIVMNLYPTFMSEEIWGDPQTFRPERFLNEHGELISYPELIPFGLGRRRCIADTFAQQCLFLFVSELLRTYKMLPIDENNLPTASPLPGIILSPKPYHARFVRREEYVLT